MDCQPILSRHTIMKYISKYASKAEGQSKSYHHILTRITDTLSPKDPASFSYRSFHTESIVDRDIGTHETYHMLQKLPLVTCSCLFMTLNVGRHIFRRVSKYPSDCLSLPSLIPMSINLLALNPSLSLKLKNIGHIVAIEKLTLGNEGAL
jgi:hypothetical protein